MFLQSQTDAILGWVEKTGRSFLMDTWIVGYSMPSVDPSQNIDKKEGRIENGATVLSFTRKRNTGDPKVKLNIKKNINIRPYKYTSKFWSYKWKIDKSYFVLENS